MRKYMLSLLIIILLVSTGVSQVNSETKIIKETTDIKNKCVDKKQTIVYNKVKPEEKTTDNYIMMKSTAYDLSVQCCGKSYSNPSRGITRDGYNLNNKSHRQALTVASNRFPIGTKLKLEFPESHKRYNGIYTVRDTGNFDENVLDVYVGDFGERVHQDTINFSRVDVKVYIIE